MASIQGARDHSVAGRAQPRRGRDGDLLPVTALQANIRVPLSGATAGVTFAWTIGRCCMA